MKNIEIDNNNTNTNNVNTGTYSNFGCKTQCLNKLALGQSEFDECISRCDKAEVYSYSTDIL
ncbi:hypothetical protein [Wolbachia endosymbiont of Folsomia candida]|uniref:hypothetical protein n=1 Tax=Wolbachia endosymbiont of Folsomia candida TaxID=169402 RepID=UPI000ACB1209|nr:hypothetical protein [Wolbachia endosymbiont of Folsomia candida]APR98338.1 hypothetical protein ASM33_03500 [Wolbachia endosymbiont of Folsomia candida]